jgi:hypothetical protein
MKEQIYYSCGRCGHQLGEYDHIPETCKNCKSGPYAKFRLHEERTAAGGVKNVLTRL